MDNRLTVRVDTELLGYYKNKPALIKKALIIYMENNKERKK